MSSNRFNGWRVAVQSINGDVSSLETPIAGNIFSSVDTCVYLSDGDHSALTIACNVFENYGNYAICSQNADLQDQGNSEAGAGNLFFPSESAETNVNHQLLHMGNSLNYYCDPSTAFTLQTDQDFTATTHTASADLDCTALFPNRKGSVNQETQEISSVDMYVNVFPNPFTNHIIIKYRLPAGCSGAGILQIFDASSGRLVYNQNLHGQGGELSIGTSSLAAGVYICSILTAEGHSKHLKIVNIR